MYAAGMNLPAYPASARWLGGRTQPRQGDWEGVPSLGKVNGRAYPASASAGTAELRSAPTARTLGGRGTPPLARVEYLSSRTAGKSTSKTSRPSRHSSVSARVSNPTPRDTTWGLPPRVATASCSRAVKNLCLLSRPSPRAGSRKLGPIVSFLAAFSSRNLSVNSSDTPISLPLRRRNATMRSLVVCVTSSSTLVSRLMSFFRRTAGFHCFPSRAAMATTFARRGPEEVRQGLTYARERFEVAGRLEAFRYAVTGSNTAPEKLVSAI
mmetsp:Transcript_16981/g.53933  ORF Transcript_16981/g.53933 Transcript_16981/m.53933 type:complete len:267 (-) Transcript_16981:67-867(-)